MSAKNNSNQEIIRKREGIIFFILFSLCIPAANWLIQHVGTFCVPNGPCIIPVGFGFTAPSGVMLIGLALVLRDLVQRRLGLIWAFASIGFGGILSAFFAPQGLVLASVFAFFFSEITDLAVFTPMQKKGLVLAVFLSSFAGLVADSVIFLYLAFGSLDYLAGQILGKFIMVIATVPIINWLRNRDNRLGLTLAL